MSLHLQRQFDRIRKQILGLGALVEKDVQDAIRAIETRSVDLAQGVIDRDEEIDQMEIDVEDECLHTLACYHPVAQDLRFVVCVLKINNDLERIGDLAVNIAEEAISLVGFAEVPFQPFGLYEMARRARTMLTQSLDAVVKLDCELADQVRQSDDNVDELHRQVYAMVEDRVRHDAADFPQLLRLLIAARQIERIADHAVNIAEDVVYLAKGQIVRHTT